MSNMDELKEKYYDLNNLIENLSLAVNECQDEDYKEEILELIRNIQTEIEDIEPQIARQEREEQKELENEFERSRLC